MMTATPSPEALVERLEALSAQSHDVAGAQEDIRAAAALIRELVGQRKELREAIRGVLEDDDASTSLADQRARWPERMDALKRALEAK